MPEARLLWLPLVVGCGALYVWLALALVYRRTGPGSRTMGLALGAIAVWVSAAAAEVLLPTQAAYFFAVHVKYTAVALTPPGFLLFIVHYTERFPVRPHHVALLLLVPLCTIAAVWTNPWHELPVGSPAARPGR